MPETLERLYRQVARKVLSESIGLKKGESLTVETWTSGFPFARTVVSETRKIGGIPIMLYEDEDLYIEGVRNTPKDVLGTMGKHENALLAGSDAYVFIPGPPIGAYSRKITRQEVIDSTKYNSSWYEAAEKAKLRGVRLTFGYVGEDLAKLLRKNVAEVVAHQLRASLVDFDKMREKGKVVAKHLSDGSQAKLNSADMKLDFEFQGELEIQDGVTDEEDVSGGNTMSYVPPGYVYKKVNTTSVSGKVKLSPSVTRFGLLHDATIEFDRGKIVRWSSTRSSEILKKIDAVVSEKGIRLSYVTVGLNPSMRLGFAQDRFPAGSIGLGMEFTGIVANGTLEVEGDVLVNKGRLA